MHLTIDKIVSVLLQRKHVSKQSSIRMENYIQGPQGGAISTRKL